MDLDETRKCCACGKIIECIKFNMTDYQYKLKIRHKGHDKTCYYCSYTCYRKGYKDSGLMDKDNKFHSRWI